MRNAEIALKAPHAGQRPIETASRQTLDQSPPIDTT
jgi:hypothetical protein